MRRTTPGTRLESDEQRDLFTWWRMAARGFGIDPTLMFMIPNGAYLGAGYKELRNGKRVSLAAIRFKRLEAQGFVQGVPDIFLAVPRDERSGLFIEMKRKGGVTSPEQEAIIERLRERGYDAHVAYGFEEARSLVDRYLS